MEIDSYFTITEIEKTIHNLQQFIGFNFQKTPLKKIFVNEGFQSGEQSSSDELEFVSIKTKNKKKKHSLEKKPTDIPSIECDQAQLLIQQQLLQEANDKINRRDEQILQMTMNYLKDIQHIKSMFLKQLENPDTEFIEVNYFDLKQSLEPEVQQYISDKFNQLNTQWIQTVQKYKIELTAASIECESYKKTIQVLLQNNSIQSIIKMLFLIERDPYKIWKQIQDQVGNKLLFQVFENQVGGYGINYREIDELIAKNSSGERMFQRQKAMYEEQLKILIDDNIHIINNLRGEITKLETQLQEQQSVNEEFYSNLKQNFNEQLQYGLKAQKSQLLKEFQQERKTIQNDLCDSKMIQKISFQAAFFRWRSFVKIYEIFKQHVQDEDGAYKLKQMIKNHVRQGECQINREEFEKLKEDYEKSQLLLIQNDIDLQFLDTRCNQLQMEIQKYINNITMLKQMITNLKSDLQALESQIKIISKPFCFVLQKIGYPSKINLLSILKSGVSFDFLQWDDQEIKSSLMNYFLMALSSQQIHKQPISKEAETITEFFDIRFSISQELNYENQLGSQIQEIPAIKFQITDQAISPKDVVNFTYDKPFQKGTQKTSNPTNQTPKSIMMGNINNSHSQRDTPKVKKENKEKSVNTRRRSQQLMLETNSSEFQKQVEKIRVKQSRMIKEINYSDKAIQVDVELKTTRNRQSETVQFKEDIQYSPQQDFLVIMREDCQSRSSSVPKGRSISHNQKKHKICSPNNFLNTQNISLLQATKIKTLNRTIYSDNQHCLQEQTGISFPPQSPFQFYQDLFKEKQKLQLKNYTIVREQGYIQQNYNKKRQEPSIEGRQLQIPFYLKQ